MSEHNSETTIGSVSVVGGIGRGRSAALDQDGLLIVGRGGAAHLRVEKDTFLGRQQFLVEARGTECVLIPLPSVNPIALNGAVVDAETPLDNGDVIEAGHSTFRVHLPPTVPAHVPDSHRLPASAAHRRRRTDCGACGRRVEVHRSHLIVDEKARELTQLPASFAGPCWLCRAGDAVVMPPGFALAAGPALPPGVRVTRETDRALLRLDCVGLGGVAPDTALEAIIGAAELEHPHVLAPLDAFVMDGSVWVLSDSQDAIGLGLYLSQAGGRLRRVERALALVSQLLLGLQAIEDAGLPAVKLAVDDAEVTWSPRGPRARVSAFAVARALVEHLAGHEPADSAASGARVLYELLAGQPPGPNPIPLWSLGYGVRQLSDVIHSHLAGSGATPLAFRHALIASIGLWE